MQKLERRPSVHVVCMGAHAVQEASMQAQYLNKQNNKRVCMCVCVRLEGGGGRGCAWCAPVCCTD